MKLRDFQVALARLIDNHSGPAIVPPAAGPVNLLAEDTVGLHEKAVEIAFSSEAAELFSLLTEEK